MAQDVPFKIFMNYILCKTTHSWNSGIQFCSILKKCGERPNSFATFVANKKIHLDIAALE